MFEKTYEAFKGIFRKSESLAIPTGEVAPPETVLDITQKDIAESISRVIGFKVEDLPETISVKETKQENVLGYALRGLYQSHLVTERIGGDFENLWVTVHEDVHCLVPLLLDPERIGVELKTAFLKLGYPKDEINYVSNVLNEKIADARKKLNTLEIAEDRKMLKGGYQELKGMIDKHITDPAEYMSEMRKFFQERETTPQEKKIIDVEVKIEEKAESAEGLLSRLHNLKEMIYLPETLEDIKDEKFRTSLKKISDYHRTKQKTDDICEGVCTALEEGLTEYLTLKVLKDIATQKNDEKLKEYIRDRETNKDALAYVMLSYKATPASPLYQRIAKLIYENPKIVEEVAELKGKKCGDFKETLSKLTIKDLVETSKMAYEKLKARDYKDPLFHLGSELSRIKHFYEEYEVASKEALEEAKKIAPEAYEKIIERVGKLDLPKSVLAARFGSEWLGQAPLAELDTYITYVASRIMWERAYEKPQELIADLNNNNIYPVFEKLVSNTEYKPHREKLEIGEKDIAKFFIGEGTHRLYINNPVYEMIKDYVKSVQRYKPNLGKTLLPLLSTTPAWLEKSK